MKRVFLFLLFASICYPLQKDGIEFGVDSGYRRDWLTWQVYFTEPNAPVPISNREKYPHINIWESRGFFDGSWKGVHLDGEGAIGVFWNQKMNLSVPVPVFPFPALPFPAKFEFNASGWVSTLDARLGYQIDLIKELSFLPFIGYGWERYSIKRDHPNPAVFTSSENIPGFAFADFTADLSHRKLTEDWYGVLLGGRLFWQISDWFFDGSYAYQWLNFHQTNSRTIHIDVFLPGPILASSATNVVNDASIKTSKAHGQQIRFRTGWQVNSWFSLALNTRYQYLFTGVRSLTTTQMNTPGGQSTVTAPFKAWVQSFWLMLEGAFSF